MDLLINAIIINKVIIWENKFHKRNDVIACLPYISGLTEPLTRLLRNDGIRVVTKPRKTLQQEFPSPKFRSPIDSQTNVVYRIPCNHYDCPWNYIGETGRCFLTRKKEYIRNVKNSSKGSNIANHPWLNNPSIDFKNAIVIDKVDYRVRKKPLSHRILPRQLTLKKTPNRYLDNRFYSVLWDSMTKAMADMFVSLTKEVN